jgi:hypothetical protein
MDHSRLSAGARVGVLLGVLIGGSLFAYVVGGLALAKQHPVALTIVAILACLDILVLMTTLKQDESFSSKASGNVYVAGMIAAVTLLPTGTILITVVIYLVGSAGNLAPIWGSIISSEAFLLAAYVCRGLGKAEKAVPSSYSELSLRLADLKTAIEISDNEVLKAVALKDVRAIEADLNVPGPRWVLGTGYAKVWERVYRAEEALIEIEPEEMVLAGAIYDESRLIGSKIENRDKLLRQQRQGVTDLDPSAARYLTPLDKVMSVLAISTSSPLPEGTVNTLYTQTLTASGGIAPYAWKLLDDQKKLGGLQLDSKGVLIGTPTEPNKQLNLTVRVTDSASQMTEKLLSLTVKDAAARAPKPEILPSPLTEGPVKADDTGHTEEQKFTPTVKGTGTHSTPPLCDSEQKKRARAVLRIVRRSINEFRNQSWNGLILARNHLLETMLCTGLTLFLLLAIAIIWGARPSTVFAASVFFLVGATTGLSDRLRRESEADAAFEDYGLSTARLVTIPLFSGLGAIAGVLFVAMLPVSSSVLGPKAAVPPAPALAISTVALSDGEVAKAYSQQLEASGGTQPYAWTVSEGAIPDGLALTPAGLLQGTPTNDGIGNFVVRVSDNAGILGEKRFALPIKKKTEDDTPLTISTTSPLPGATVDRDYSERLQATGGVPPYIWTLAGAIPDGLQLSPKGLLSVKPRAAGFIKITGQVKDQKDKTITKEIDLPINQPEQAPTASVAARGTSEQIPPLDTIFNLDKNLIGLLVAAVFGLTPGLVFESLRKQAVKYEEDLKSTQATTGALKT